jgi:hypothetical protein
MKIDLIILGREHASALTEDINKQLARGYELHGFVFVNRAGYFCQAMIKKV